ncbi:hypothetical protein YQE_12139, partial [Dendroctonus ponderosae]
MLDATAVTNGHPFEEVLHHVFAYWRLYFEDNGPSYCERIFKDCRLQTCYVQSPAYPGVYPRNLHCRYYLNTRLPFIKLYIENEEFNIDGQRCENIMTCPMRPISSGKRILWYFSDSTLTTNGCRKRKLPLRLHQDPRWKERAESSGMGKFPYSIIGTSQDLFVEFVTSPAGPLLNTGFHFNVGNWPGHVDTAGSRNGTCDWLLSSESLRASRDSEGIFLSVAHWYPPHTSCTYLMQGEEGEIVRLYFPRQVLINRIESPIQPTDSDCGESLTLYDASWADDSKIIKTFCDTFSKAMEKYNFVSTGNSLFVKFESQTGSYSGSSLYYWAHYDFFNNTKLGEPVPGKKCDEVFASWKQSKGWMRSPLNTLIYKQQHTNEDVSCLYRFVSDKRLFSRVILTITCVNFKDNPYNSGPRINCIEDRVDKLVIWEPLPPGANSSHSPTPLSKAMHSGDVTCICKRQSFSTQIVSKSEHLNLQLIVDSTHSAQSYFKQPSPLFEATYEFVHGPLCGPAIIHPVTDGEIHYPYYEAIGYVEPPKSIRCIWEVKVSNDRDLWLHFDHIKFNSNACDDGIVDIFLKGRPNPFLSLCGQNVSLVKEIPILSSKELSPDGGEPSITIQFIGRSSPTRAAFKITWTELFHLPRNIDGSVKTSKLVEGGASNELEECEFTCPGELGVCIPARLVCNGVINCPNATDHKGSFYNDESPDVCVQVSTAKINWFYVGAATISVMLFLCGCCIFLCRKCYTDCSTRD